MRLFVAVPVPEELRVKAAELGKSLTEPRVLLGNLYIRQKQTEKALSEYESATRNDPKNPGLYVLIGSTYDQLANIEKAKEAYENALKLDPKNPIASNNLAANYSEHGGNIDVALNLAQTAKELAPDNPYISDTLGWIYYKKNAYRTAIDMLKQSAKQLDKSAIVRYHLGMAYYKNGDREMAKKELATALSLGANFAGADEARSTLKAIGG